MPAFDDLLSVQLAVPKLLERRKRIKYTALMAYNRVSNIFRCGYERCLEHNVYSSLNWTSILTKYMFERNVPRTLNRVRTEYTNRLFADTNLTGKNWT